MTSDQYPAIMYTIHMRRTGVYYVNMFVWPAVILAFLTAFMFLVPPEAGERVHIGNRACSLNKSRREKSSYYNILKLYYQHYLQTFFNVNKS